MPLHPAPTHIPTSGLHPYIPTGGGGGGGGKDKDNMEKIQLDQGAVAYLLGRNGASAAPKT